MRRIIVMVLLGLLLAGMARATMLPTAADRFVGQVSSDGFYDYPGLVHFHTEYSGDAMGSYSQIARDASAAGVRFMIATEHDNLNAKQDGREGWYGDTLMLSGVESTRPEGYLLGLGIDRYPVTRQTPTSQVIETIKAQNGLVVLAHPRHRRWAWQGPIDDRVDAIEILDLADSFYASTSAEKATAIMLLPFNRTAAYLELGRHSGTTLAAWDAVTKHRRFVGLYAPDFHQSIKVSDDNHLKFPPARDLVGLVRNHIVTRTPLTGGFEHDRQLIYDCLRQGQLYVSLDVLGDATGFMFSGRRDDALITMGQEVEMGAPVLLSVTLPPKAQHLGARVHLLRDGVEIAAQTADNGHFSFKADDPGVYRIEVRVNVPTFFGRDRRATWIYSNPIYIRA